MTQIQTDPTDIFRDTAPTSRWRKLALEAYRLATVGREEAAEEKFRGLNREISEYLQSGGTRSEELDDLLTDIIRFNRIAGTNWRWSFHHALLS